LYLDELIKENKLDNHDIDAYLDDIKITMKTTTELAVVTRKLEKISDTLQLNKAKCGILTTDPKIAFQKKFREFPIVQSYKYLGHLISTNTSQTKA
jgi:hypothetical protein